MDYQKMHKTKSFLFAFFMANIVAYADPVTVPNTFSAGTPAKASEVNANFNALANAINANAGSKPLMVYDSTGKAVGQYGWNETLYVTEYGPPFIINRVAKSGLGAGGSVYYTSMDCTGTPFFLVPNPNTSMLVIAQVIDNIAYIPSESGVQMLMSSFRVSGKECVNQYAITNAAPADRVVDLSSLIPPFSVH